MPNPAHTNEFPEALLVFLAQVFGSSRHLTAIETSFDHKVIRWYGEPDFFALKLTVGEPVIDAMPAMLGLEHLSELELPNIEVAPGRPFDLFLLPLADGARRLIVLLDAREAVDHVQEIQQKAHEISILSYRQEQLMKDLEEARRQAEQASRLKSQFIAGMSHEFRTPLTAILGLCEIMRRHPGEAPDRVDSVGRSANHLLALVENLLEHGQIESREPRIDPVPIALQSTIQSLSGMFDPLARQKSLQLSFTPEGELPETVITDPVRLRQILVNLIANALRYTAVGEVRVQWAHEQNRLTVSVIDTGPGIPIDQQQRIFQPFAQLQGDLGKGGIGLGLSICQKMAEALGGAISLVSTPGKGSTFTLEIPCVVCETVSAIEPPQDGERVLVVDDDPDIRELLSVVLTDMAFQVHTVSTAEEAEQLFEAESPGLVLCDVNLKGEDGLALIDQLTDQEAAPRVIAMSATNDEHSRRAARGAGASSYLLKPFDFAELEYELRNQQITRERD